MQMSEFGIIRNIADCELELMLSWRNAPGIRNNMYTRQVISLGNHLKWWSIIRCKADQRYFMYEYMGRPLGIISFNDIDLINGNSAWAFYASPEAPKGTGSRMEFVALEYAFLQMKLNRLYCEVLDFNQPVVSMHKKFGFTEEGVKRKHHKMDDGFHDIVCLGILADEWSVNRDGMKVKILDKQRG